MSQALSYPLPTTLTASLDGRSIAFAIDQQGRRSIWVATAPDFLPRNVVLFPDDEGQAISSVRLSPDGAYVVYVQGNPEDPTANVAQPHPAIWSIDLATGQQSLLGDGTSPAISPSGTRVAFEHDGEVWSVPINGSMLARPLFYDAGVDSDLQWSPDGHALAFVSSRVDHSFIGIYRDGLKHLIFAVPSAFNDVEPRWSPDGTHLAFIRMPGSGGRAPSPLREAIVPWSIWNADPLTGAGRVVWRSPRTARASFPTEGGDVDLTWAGTSRLIFVCEQDNWPHLYDVSAEGGAATRLTTGSYAVTGFAVAQDASSVIYSANVGSLRDDVDRWHLYRVDISTRRVSTLTSGTGSQWWPTVLADGKLAYVTATGRTPPLIALTDADARYTRIVDGDLLPRDFPSSALVTPTEVQYRAPDGLLIHAQLFRLPGLVRAPAVVFVHGGPMRQMLLTWNPIGYYDNSYAVNEYLASRGFAVLSVNYRSGVDYGHDFHYALRTGWTGAAEYQDVLAGARWLQRQRFVNPSRIGIWGGSWGGYLTALALARNSNVFKVGVDYSGVHDLMHDAMEYFHAYGEGALDVDMKPWLRLAWSSSPIASVSTWRSPVLLVQGDSDPEVSFHQLVDLVPRLEEHRVPFQLLVLPDEAHSFLRYASWLRSDEAAAAFFEKHLR